MLNAREVKQVGIRMIGKGAVRIGWHQVIGIDDCERISRQAIEQSLAVEPEKARVNRVVPQEIRFSLEMRPVCTHSATKISP